MNRKTLLLHGGICLVAGSILLAASNPLSAAQVIDLWPGQPPGESKELPPEADTTKPGDNLIAGQRVMRIGNVSTPTITVYPAPRDGATGASVIICPGGGHHILAWDLEGTEVAEWLNSIGVTAFLLKYRVPAREGDPRWRAAVQDAQRAVSMARHRAESFDIDPARIGVLGFSAGGETAALAALLKERTYEAVDEADQVSVRPNFAVLTYAAGLANRENTALRDYIHVDETTPPMFLAHAYDDRVRIENPVLLFLELKKHDIPAELHVYSRGGHGYGLRETQQPVTTWHRRCAEWMKTEGLLEPKR